MNRAFVAVVTAVLTAASVLVASARAKEGVVARVLSPIQRDAPAGKTVTVVWTLSSVEAGKRHPFNAEGIFIRLFGPDGSRSARAYATQPEVGRYRATVAIPRGGVRRVVIGLMGTSCDSNGCRPAPVLFTVAGEPLR